MCGRILAVCFVFGLGMGVAHAGAGYERVETLLLNNPVSRVDLGIAGSPMWIEPGSIIRLVTTSEGRKTTTKSCIIRAGIVEKLRQSQGGFLSSMSNRMSTLSPADRRDIRQGIRDLRQTLRAHSLVADRIYDEYLGALIIDNLDQEFNDSGAVEEYLRLMATIDQICH